jgi:hypothetical protein
MAFSVQNDTGTVTDANAYISVNEFKTYWGNKAVDISALTDPEIEGLIVAATQYIDQRYKYKGTPLAGRDQTTEFPRADLYDNYANVVEGVPREVKDACSEYALESNTTDLSNTITATEQGLKREMSKIDVIEEEKEYIGRSVSSSTWNVYQIADNILLNSGFVIQFYGVGRA